MDNRYRRFFRCRTRFLLGNLIRRGNSKNRSISYRDLDHSHHRFIFTWDTDWVSPHKPESATGYGFLVELVFVGPIQLFQPLETKPLSLIQEKKLKLAAILMLVTSIIFGIISAMIGFYISI